MKKFINDTANIVTEALRGYTRAYPKMVMLGGDNLVLRAAKKDSGKVAIVTIHGSGHEPALSGFVGKGMLDVGVPGEIFAAPGPNRVFKAVQDADVGAGVLLFVLNHEGDVLSARLVMEMVEDEALNVKEFIFGEDVSAAPRSEPENRRGLVGCLPLVKMLGAAAEEGASLDDLVAMCQTYHEGCGTLAVAVTSGTHPATGQPFFSLPDDEMEIGMGAHGEAGIGRMKIASAVETGKIMLDKICEDISLKAGDKTIVVVNGAGATTLMELQIIFDGVATELEARGASVERAMVGNFFTTQEQAGFMLSIARVDDEMVRLFDAPCNTPYLSSLGAGQ